MVVIILLLFFLHSTISYECYGLDEGDGGVCSGHGECIGEDDCYCDRYYTGAKCSLSSTPISNRKKWMAMTSVPVFRYDSNCDSGIIDPKTAVTVFWKHPKDSSADWVSLDYRDSLGDDVSGWVAPKINPDGSADICMDEDESWTWECMGCNKYDCDDMDTGSFPPTYQYYTDILEDVKLEYNDCHRYSDECIGEANAYMDINCDFKRTISDTETLHYCYGYRADDYERSLCGPHGICAGEDYCKCFDRFTGIYCDTLATCYGYNNTEVEFVCSGHGQCVDTDVCECEDFYYGDKCGNYSCFGIYYNETETVCSGRGICTHHNSCVCSNYTGAECEIPECYGYSSNDLENVCSGHGACMGPNNCTCQTDPLYPGDYCQLWSCFNLAAQASATCGGHGVCVDWDTCHCLSGYSSPVVFGECTDFYCGEHKFDSPTACNHRGDCVGSHECDCNEGYFGDLCELFSCNGIRMSLVGTVCGGNGKCIAPDFCECDYSFYGDDCTNSIGLAVSSPILVVFGGWLFFVIFVLPLCIMCCLIYCIIFLIPFCCCCCCCVLLKQSFKLNRFGKLENFDIYLAEQKLEQRSESGEIATLRINKQLFEISMDSIKILEHIGSGGSQSAIYRCSWEGRIACFKVFKTSSVCSSQETFDEFECEVEILSSISHPTIISFYGCSLKPPRVGIVMEYCENGDLQHFLLAYPEMNKGTSYHVNGKLRMLMEICIGMAYLHERSIIHRDLKMENVLVDLEEHCKIVDFGLSRIVERMSSSKTKRIGTSIYISPEVMTNSKYDEKCDVFSFSIMCFVMMTENMRPYGNDEACVELKVANDENYRPNIEEMKDVNTPEFLLDITQRCWSADPKNRYSFKELVDSFRMKSNKSLKLKVSNQVHVSVGKRLKNNEEIIREQESNILDLLEEIKNLKEENQMLKSNQKCD